VQLRSIIEMLMDRLLLRADLILSDRTYRTLRKLVRQRSQR
jgi:hypothetical protein